MMQQVSACHALAATSIGGLWLVLATPGAGGHRASVPVRSPSPPLKQHSAAVMHASLIN